MPLEIALAGFAGAFGLNAFVTIPIQITAASIFEVFKRLHGRGEYAGSGIGLSICRRIVERHHGRISAVGHPGEGAEFRISLPVQQAKQEVTHAAA